MYWASDRIGGPGGVLAMAAVAAVGGAALWLTSRRNPVTPSNVNTGVAGAAA